MEWRRTFVWTLALVVAGGWWGAVEVCGYSNAECQGLGYACACNWKTVGDSAPCECGNAKTFHGSEHCCTPGHTCVPDTCMPVGKVSTPDWWTCGKHPGCQWSDWEWTGGCSTTCGTGDRPRRRTCSEGNGATETDRQPCSAGSRLICRP